MDRDFHFPSEHSTSSRDPSTDDGLLTHSDANDDASKKKKNAFHWNRDTKNVFVWMVVVLGMIGVTAAIVLSFTISFLSDQEKSEFENGFKQQSNVIAEATRFHAKTVVGSLESMSDTITSYVGASTATFPFVTVPDFVRRGQRARVEAYIEVIAFSPLVTYEDRHRWSTFASYSSDWLGPNATAVPSEIYSVDDDSGDAAVDDNILMVPVWMTSPKPHNTSVINFNIISDSTYNFLFNAMTESKHTALSAVYSNSHMTERLSPPERHEAHHEGFAHGTLEEEESHSSDEPKDDAVLDDFAVEVGEIPHSVLMAPVYDSFDSESRSLAGVIHGTLPWDSYLTELLPPGVNGIVAVLKNSCGQSFTFHIDGPKATFIGEGDLHDEKYRSMAKEVDFGSDFLGEETRTYRQCFYSLTIYPSQEFEDNFESSDTEQFATILAIVFVCLAVVFFIFVWFVQRRQQKVMGIATRTTAIISNLFPDNVRERIMKQAEEQASREVDGSAGAEASSNLKSILQQDQSSLGFKSRSSLASGHLNKGQMPTGVTVLEDAPIADLYPDCTVFFADIVGFTAWSSTRDPAQVFVLLETLYGAFDVIAKRRRIFKVETIGDCYVAVAGLPQPRRDHALGMSRFAHDCLVKSSEVFHCLEITLGPGTSRLNMRLGLHSGPVTAGVLRGEKGRFQLFGDTVNTAARMESNSAAGKIHCSKDTADLIMAGGKSQWVSERADKIVAKGKGEMTTYWISVRNTDSGETVTSGDSSELSMDDAFACIQSLNSSVLPMSTRRACSKSLSSQHARLVAWNVELLASLLVSVVANRQNENKSMFMSTGSSEPSLTQEAGQMPFNEWSQSIDLPGANKRRGSKTTPTKLPDTVVSQLQHFVTAIALLHGNNPFHSFDHASHVTMSVHKLLLRVIQSGKESYGIASDPLTHFGAVFSALIHDVDHRGVPNAKLVLEDPELAAKYDETSVAEQHAIDLAWNLLMSEEYTDLRRTIYTTDNELQRFRTVIVNSVLSTDIVNKDLKELRNERWALAFSEDAEDANRYRASSVLEHLIQASDVSHTMQHWHVYRTWNERLFEEMYLAYKQGRADKDPSEFWYKGELGFFDFYIIPLAKKLAEVGVFGVSSSEYLDFAMKNRAEWELKGKEVVEGMILKVNGRVDERSNVVLLNAQVNTDVATDVATEAEC